MTIYHFPFIDFTALNTRLSKKEMPAWDKLAQVYALLGGEFYDPEKQIMKGAVVGITAIGGLNITLDNEGLPHILGQPTTLHNIRASFLQTAGQSAFMSYLNPKNKTLSELAQATLAQQHTSVLHTLNLSVLVVGITSGVEHEFSSQRDLVHLSRLTVAKTKAQLSPTLVLHNPDYYPAYKAVLKATQDALETHMAHSAGEAASLDLETQNLLFPSAKASAVLLTGSLKNFQKLVALKDAGGKESEFIAALEKIERVLQAVSPTHN